MNIELFFGNDMPILLKILNQFLDIYWFYKAITEMGVMSN